MNAISFVLQLSLIASTDAYFGIAIPCAAAISEQNIFTSSPGEL